MFGSGVTRQRLRAAKREIDKKRTVTPAEAARQRMKDEREGGSIAKRAREMAERLNQ